MSVAPLVEGAQKLPPRLSPLSILPDVIPVETITKACPSPVVSSRLDRHWARTCLSLYVPRPLNASLSQASATTSATAKGTWDERKFAASERQAWCTLRPTAAEGGGAHGWQPSCCSTLSRLGVRVRRRVRTAGMHIHAPARFESRPGAPHSRGIG